MGAFVDEGENQGTSDTSQAPSGQNTTVDSTKLFGAEKVTQICRHTGEATAVASDDDEDQRLEHKTIGYTCQKVEGYDLDCEEQYVGVATTNIVRQG